jgi:hypothetical protein
MKITNFGIIFILIIIPFMLFSHFEIRKETVSNFQNRSYDNIVEKALSDASEALIMDVDVNRDNRIEINKDYAIETFFKTLSLSFGYKDIIDIEYLKSYVPIIIIIDYDGIYTYSVEKYNALSGEILIKHVLHEKKYFTYTEGNNIITLYLDGSYKVLSLTKNRTFYGTYDELKAIAISIFFDNTEAEIEELRNKIVVDLISNELLKINDHNTFAEINGVKYDFFIPDTKYDLDTNTIDNIGIIASIQGFPKANGKYNNFSVAINAIKERQRILGYNDAGKLVYHEEGCPGITGILIEVFDSKKEAAQNGYYPDYECN